MFDGVLKRILLTSCDALRRMELDDDATINADGIRVDHYGGECGEWSTSSRRVTG